MYTAHSFPGVSPAEYDAKTHAEVLVVVQIESRPGVENVEEIAKVEGLDVLFIGETPCRRDCLGVVGIWADLFFRALRSR
jgi:2-keto-3-deoxy-L-rhamnonate aldolase RhmA